MVSFTYMIINTSVTPNLTCCQMEELLGFIHYILFEANQSMFETYQLVPVHRFIAHQIVETVLKKIVCDGQLVWEELLNSEKPKTQYSMSIVIATTAAAVIALISTMYILVKLYRWYKKLYDASRWDLKRVEICKSANRPPPSH